MDYSQSSRSPHFVPEKDVKPHIDAQNGLRALLSLRTMSINAFFVFSTISTCLCCCCCWCFCCCWLLIRSAVDAYCCCRVDRSFHGFCCWCNQQRLLIKLLSPIADAPAPTTVDADPFSTAVVLWLLMPLIRNYDKSIGQSINTNQSDAIMDRRCRGWSVLCYQS